MSVLISIVAINNEEMLKKDFPSKYFLEVKTKGNVNKNPV